MVQARAHAAYPAHDEDLTMPDDRDPVEVTADRLVAAVRRAEQKDPGMDGLPTEVIRRLLRHYEVEGSGPFPHDMLRYDEAWLRRDEPGTGRRRVGVVGIHPPTVARWASFGWRVVPVAEDPR